MKSILNPAFRYVPSVSTDLKRTFARVREEQREAAALQAAEIAKRKAETVRDLQRVVTIFDRRRKDAQ